MRSSEAFHEELQATITLCVAKALKEDGFDWEMAEGVMLVCLKHAAEVADELEMEDQWAVGTALDAAAKKLFDLRP